MQDQEPRPERCHCQCGVRARSRCGCDQVPNFKLCNARTNSLGGFLIDAFCLMPGRGAWDGTHGVCWSARGNMGLTSYINPHRVPTAACKVLAHRKLVCGTGDCVLSDCGPTSDVHPVSRP